MLTIRSPCSSKCRAVGTFFSDFGFFTIHFKSCNVIIATTFPPIGSGRPDGSAQKSSKKAAKKVPDTPVFFNGSLELLLLPAKACIYFITGTAGSIPFSIAPEDAASMVLFFSFPPQSTRNNPPLRHKGSFSDRAGFLPWSSFSLLPHICALHIQCIILPTIFPLQIWGNSQDFPSYLWILPYSLNPIYQGAHGLDHDFLFLWTQVQDTGNHLVGGIFLYSRLPSQ